MMFGVPSAACGARGVASGRAVLSAQWRVRLAAARVSEGNVALPVARVAAPPAPQRSAALAACISTRPSPLQQWAVERAREPVGLMAPRGVRSVSNLAYTSHDSSSASVSRVTGLMPLGELRPLTLQIRAFAGKRSRTGRLQHFRFGTDKVKGRWYYRFHKIIGKWNWRKYTERFIAPRALENRQRFIPSMSPLFKQARESYSWYWRLPKGLAEATTADEVLEVWIKFRHKLPKRTPHYFKVLSRLVEVGGCDATDWRLKFITSRLHSIHRKILNLPRLAFYYAKLRVMDELEHVSRFLYPMLRKYTPAQLALTAHAFGVARLQDKRLMSEIARLLEPRLDALSPPDLVKVAEAFAATEICHYTFLTRLSAQVQVRVQSAAEGRAPIGSTPSFEQLADIASAFAAVKLQDYSYFEMCTTQAEHLLQEGLPGPTPPALAQLCSATARLKIHEVRLYEAVLAHIADHWYDYPAGVLAEIGAAVTPSLPREHEELRSVYMRMLQVIRNDRDKLTLKGLDQAARFMAEVDHKEEFLPGLAQALTRRLKDLRDEGKERYDVARVAEVFARRCPGDLALFSCLCKHVHRHLGVFEPVDFVRFARGLAATEYRDDRVVHAIAKWARKRLQEFSAFDWQRLVNALADLGAREASLARLRELKEAPPELVGGASPSSSPVSAQV